ncbi:MAG TPA: hypothetical protein VFN91_06640 [Myxococcaceae bacterium]|nr:hypothetical protein [Myxococcaceae bacterium]
MVPARHLARKFTLYGCAGWVLEVLFTGTKAALSKDKKLAARTYLWMHPIYGAAGLTLEELHRRLAKRSRLTRALASLGVIYATEYASGAALRRVLGDCPWQYRNGVHLHGLVRLDYAPFWLAAALGFEWLRDGLQAQPARTAVGPGLACPTCGTEEPPNDRIAA